MGEKRRLDYANCAASNEIYFSCVPDSPCNTASDALCARAPTIRGAGGTSTAPGEQRTKQQWKQAEFSLLAIMAQELWIKILGRRLAL